LLKLIAILLSPTTPVVVIEVETAASDKITGSVKALVAPADGVN
jgi:hypothetical protein